tara:strand:- start:6459 stop:6635 length:177 start_codon:yes stop_codon:yes gene_type:complete
MSDNTPKTGISRRDLFGVAAGGAAFAGAAGAARLAMIGGATGAATALSVGSAQASTGS